MCSSGPRPLPIPCPEPCTCLWVRLATSVNIHTGDLLHTYVIDLVDPHCPSHLPEPD